MARESIWRGGRTLQLNGPHSRASKGRSLGSDAARRSRSCRATCSASTAPKTIKATSAIARTAGRRQNSSRRAWRTKDRSSSSGSGSSFARTDTGGSVLDARWSPGGEARTAGPAGFRATPALPRGTGPSRAPPRAAPSSISECTDGRNASDSGRGMARRGRPVPGQGGGSSAAATVLIGLQVRRRVEHFGAVAAAHPAFRNPELVRHDFEHRPAGGAAGDQAHEPAIVARAVAAPRARACRHQDPAVLRVGHLQRGVGRVGRLQFVGLALQDAGQHQRAAGRDERAQQRRQHLQRRGQDVGQHHLVLAHAPDRAGRRRSCTPLACALARVDCTAAGSMSTASICCRAELRARRSPGCRSRSRSPARAGPSADAAAIQRRHMRVVGWVPVPKARPGIQPDHLPRLRRAARARSARSRIRA